MNVRRPKPGPKNASATAPTRAPNTPGRERWIRIRMGILSGFLALGLGLVVSAGYSLMVEDGPAWRELAESQRQRRLHVLPKRGAVYVAKGETLVRVPVEIGASDGRRSEVRSDKLAAGTQVVVDQADEAE